MSKNQKVFAGVVGVVVLLAILIGGNLVSLQGKLNVSKTYNTTELDNGNTSYKAIESWGSLLVDTCVIHCPPKDGSSQSASIAKSCETVTQADIDKACASK